MIKFNSVCNLQISNASKTTVLRKFQHWRNTIINIAIVISYVEVLY